MKLNKKIVGIVTMGTALLLTACAPVDQTVASIGDQTLTKEAYYNMLMNEPHADGYTYGEIILEQYILTTILEQEYGSKVSHETVEVLLNEYAEEVGGMDALEESLKAQGFSVQDVREDLRISLLVTEGYKEHYPIAEDDVKALYDESIPAGVLVGHIFVDEEGMANEVIAKLNEGVDFTELALEYSVFDDVEVTDGIYELSYDLFSEELIEVSMTLEPGEHITEPIHDDYGYHVVQLVDAGTEQTLEERYDELEQQMYEQMSYEDPTMFNDVVLKLLEKYEEDITIHVESMDDLIERVKASTKALMNDNGPTDSDLIVDENFTVPDDDTEDVE